MPNLLSVPISAVDADWVPMELYPTLERSLAQLAGGGILWLGVDSRREGNYLLQRIRLFAAERERLCAALTVSRSDPYLFWDDLGGRGDDTSLLGGLSAKTIVCVENGFSLPLRLVRERHTVLSAYARVHELVLVIPVAHPIRNDLNLVPFIAPPPFNQFPELRRRELTAALLADAFPSHDAVLRDGRARDLVAAGPISRTELEAWVDYFAAAETSAPLPWRIPPPVPRHAAVPPEAPTRSELQARLMASMAKLREASIAFNAWRGHVLLRAIREPLNPFDASDPLHWFSATISFLACYLFDAVHESLVPLLSWRWNDAEREIENAEPLPFHDTLRALRTVTQHGLSEDHRHNRDIVDSVERWCRGGAGLEAPRRDVCRVLTAKLLSEWDEAANRLHAVVVHAPESRNRDLIESQLDLAMHRLPKYRWHELLLEAASRMGANIQVDGLLDRQLARLQRDVQDAPEKGDALMERARRLAHDVVVAELARCPVSGEDLVAAGFAPGPVLGQAKALVEERWRADATLTKDALLRLAMERFSMGATEADGSGG